MRTVTAMDPALLPPTPAAPADRRTLREEIGVVLSENYMLVPEQSTDALIAHHPQAKYFDV